MLQVSQYTCILPYFLTALLLIICPGLLITLVLLIVLFSPIRFASFQFQDICFMTLLLSAIISISSANRVVSRSPFISTHLLLRFSFFNTPSLVKGTVQVISYSPAFILFSLIIDVAFWCIFQVFFHFSGLFLLYLVLLLLFSVRLNQRPFRNLLRLGLKVNCIHLLFFSEPSLFNWQLIVKFKRYPMKYYGSKLGKLGE